jgi:hypothetical protein
MLFKLPFSDQKNLQKFSTLLAYIEGDLVQFGCTGIDVKLIDKARQRLSLAQFMGNENVADGDQAMVTTADRDSTFYLDGGGSFFAPR